MKPNVLLIETSMVRLRQLRQVFSKRCTLICKSLADDISDTIKSGQIDLVISGISDPEIATVVEKTDIQIPVVFTQHVLNYPVLEYPLNEKEITDVIEKYAVPHMRLRALAEENVELMKENKALKMELNTQKNYFKKAGAVQRGMMKKRQYTNKGVQLYAEYRPLMELGGDFYYYKLFEDKLYFCVGDVVDHGSEAAIYATELLAFLMAMLQKEPDFAELLKDFNHMACQYNPASLTATAFFGCLNVRTGELAYCNVAHEPPVLIESSAATPITQKESPLPFGCVKDVEFPVYHTKIPPNGKLLLYTDGLIEEFNSLGKNIRHEYGKTRLYQTALSFADATAERLCKGILEDVSNYTGTREQNDDLLAFCIERKGNYIDEKDI